MKRSLSTKLFWAGAIQIVLVQLLALADLARDDGSFGLDASIVLLSLGAVTCILSGLVLRLEDRRPDAPPKPAEAAAPPAAAGSPTGETAAGTTPAPVHEKEYRFWHRALVVGIVVWCYVLIVTPLSNAPPSGGEVVIFVLALPVAVACMIVARRRRDAQPALAVAWLKRPFYYAFGGVALLAILDYAERAITALQIGRFMRM